MSPDKFLLGHGRGDYAAYLALGGVPLAVVFLVWLFLMGLVWVNALRGYIAARVFLPRLALFPLAHVLVIVSELTGRFGTLAIVARTAAFLIVAFIIVESIRTFVVYRNRRIGDNGIRAK